MTTNRETVTGAFTAWSRGEGHVSRLLAEHLTWEIVGRSAAAGRYASAQQLTDEVLRPFGTRVGPDAPFRPVDVRGVHATGRPSSWCGTARAPPPAGTVYPRAGPGTAASGAAIPTTAASGPAGPTRSVPGARTERRAQRRTSTRQTTASASATGVMTRRSGRLRETALRATPRTR